MRIVIDLQGAQTESRFRGIGRYSLSLALAMARNAGHHEIWLALSGAFPERILDIRHAFDGVNPQERIRVFDVPVPVTALILMLAATWLVLTERHAHEHGHEQMAHSHRHTHDEHHQHAHRGDEGPEPHAHWHEHPPLTHSHPHTSQLPGHRPSALHPRAPG